MKERTHKLCLGMSTFLLLQGAPDCFSKPCNQKYIRFGHYVPAFLSSRSRWLLRVPCLAADSGEGVGLEMASQRKWCLP